MLVRLSLGRIAFAVSLPSFLRNTCRVRPSVVIGHTRDFMVFIRADLLTDTAAAFVAFTAGLHHVR